MVVRPLNVGVVLIVVDVAGGVRIGILRVKVVSGANATQIAHRAAEVVVVAGNQQATASLAETGDTLAVLRSKSIAGIDRKQPQLVVVGRIQIGEQGVGVPD